MRPIVVLLAFLTVSCGEAPSTEPTPVISGPGVGLSEPYPYTTPTPPARPTEVDAIYTRRLAPDQAGPRGPCRRCPPYRLEAGASTLTLDRGVFFVDNQVDEQKAIDWQSIGHYEVAGDTLTLFNDPNCPTTRGRYRWAIQGGALTLEVLDDDCAFGGLRWRYLTAGPWTATG